ncbi:MAG TPA: hypothetical protein PLV04_04470 [Phenylobacterium sp.]|nr:hypothetical protein [Phenylobacterium sp.]
MANRFAWDPSFKTTRISTGSPEALIASASFTASASAAAPLLNA